MKIELENITIDNDNLDNDNFIEILVDDPEQAIILDDLLSALKAFEEAKDRNFKRDMRYTKLK